MEFINRMKKREFIEMGLKTLACLLGGLILIILLEAMIYSIYMKKIDENTNIAYTSREIYIVETKDNMYDIYTHGYLNEGDQWARQANHHNVTKAQLDAFLKTKGKMSGYDAELYYIVVTDTGVDPTTLTYNTELGSPENQFHTGDDKHDWSENATFDIYIRKNKDTEYSDTATYQNISLTAARELFDNTQGDLADVKCVHWRAPNCFDIYMNVWHYLIMVIFELLILGLFIWRFALINKEYKKIIKKFKKTGKVFIA